MTSLRANRDSGLRAGHVDPALLRSALRTATDGTGVPEVVPLSIEVQQRLVLRALIEAFGGEVSTGALTRHLSQQFGWSAPASGPRLSDVLQSLHASGVLDLEPNGESDFIVRLLPDGAGLHPQRRS